MLLEALAYQTKDYLQCYSFLERQSNVLCRNSAFEVMQAERIRHGSFTDAGASGGSCEAAHFSAILAMFHSPSMTWWYAGM